LLLNQLGSSVKVLHFKDFVSLEPGQNTCQIGEGIIDFLPAWQWLAKNKEQDIWLTAEQDFAENADDACVHNGAYLSRKLSEHEMAAC